MVILSVILVSPDSNYSKMRMLSLVLLSLFAKVDMQLLLLKSMKQIPEELQHTLI